MLHHYKMLSHVRPGEVNHRHLCGFHQRTERPMVGATFQLRAATVEANTLFRGG